MKRITSRRLGDNLIDIPFVQNQQFLLKYLTQAQPNQTRMVNDTEKRLEFLFDRLAASQVPDIVLARLVTISQGILVLIQRFNQRIMPWRCRL